MGDHAMSDHLDPAISRLFAEQDQSLPPSDFMPKLINRLDKQKRVRRVYRVLAIVACLILLVLGAPWVAQITSTLIELTAAGVSTMSPLFFAPLTWLLVCATAAGCSPVIYLWRTGRW
jgi:H+/Cl- antiporter ClcA